MPVGNNPWDVAADDLARITAQRDELLAVCKSLLRFTDCSPGCAHIDDGEPCNCGCGEAETRARAAIDKAEVER